MASKSTTSRSISGCSGSRWFVKETYVKVSGVWAYVYRAVDQHGQVIDVYVSQRRDIASARMFFTAALTAHGNPAEVITARAPALANVIEELIPAAWHNTGQYQNNRVESDPGRTAQADAWAEEPSTASVVIRGHAWSTSAWPAIDNALVPLVRTLRFIDPPFIARRDPSTQHCRGWLTQMFPRVLGSCCRLLTRLPADRRRCHRAPARGLIGRAASPLFAMAVRRG